MITLFDIKPHIFNAKADEYNDGREKAEGYRFYVGLLVPGYGMFIDKGWTYNPARKVLNKPSFFVGGRKCPSCESPERLTREVKRLIQKHHESSGHIQSGYEVVLSVVTDLLESHGGPKPALRAEFPDDPDGQLDPNLTPDELAVRLALEVLAAS